MLARFSSKTQGLLANTLIFMTLSNQILVALYAGLGRYLPWYYFKS